MQRGVKAPPEKLHAALTGRITGRHRLLLRLHLRQFDALGAAIAEIDAEVDRDLDPFRQAVLLLRTIPGVSDLTAQVIVSEIGTDMGRFPTAGHLISWAGLCPRNDESAGKRRSTRLLVDQMFRRPRQHVDLGRPLVQPSSETDKTVFRCRCKLTPLKRSYR